MRRAPGHANAEEHPKGSGRWRVRARIDGKLKTIASGLSEAEANETADAYAVVRNESVFREGITLAQFGVGFLDRRERNGVRGIKTDRSYWRVHVDGDLIGGLPVSTLSRRDVIEWLDRRRRKHRTRKKALNLLRVALQEALDRELLQANPARDVRVHRSGDDSARDDLEGILTPAEQRALIASVPGEANRALVIFALTTGLRQAEQWWLQPGDLAGDHIVVRRSVGGFGPKSRKARTVYLLGPAARALELAPMTKEWVWPAPRGGRRQQSKAPKGWRNWVKAAGIKRRVTWHDLRHTCATALLAGWWGRKWTLDEVCQHLGHSSVTVTERYARKLAETNRLAVAETLFPESSPLMLSPASEPARKLGSRLRDLNPGPPLYESRVQRSSSVRLLGGVFPRGNIVGTPGAWALALAAEGALRPTRDRVAPRRARRRLQLSERGYWAGRKGRVAA